MGFRTEINTMLRLNSSDPKPDSLQSGIHFTSTKVNNRIYPIGYAILFLSEDWKILGYCSIQRSQTTDRGTEIEVEILSRFTDEESNIYTSRFQEAIGKTRELQQ